MTGTGYQQKFRLDPKRSALLLIDLQNDFTHPEGAFPLPGMAPVLTSLQMLAKAFRQAGQPLVYTRHISDPVKNPNELLVFPRMAEGGLRENSWGAEICGELAPGDADLVICKWRFDAFLHTGLHAKLQAMGIEDLVVAGCQTQICCDTTARSAAALDFRVTLVSDCCATRRPELQTPILTNFDQAFGQVLSAGTVVGML